MIQSLMILSVLAVSFLAEHPDRWRSQTFLGLIAITLWLAAVISRRIHWLAAIAFAIVSASGIYCFTYPVSPFAHYGKLAMTSFDAVTASSYAFFLACTLPLLFAKKAHAVYLVKAFDWLCTLSAAAIIYQWLASSKSMGVLDNPALSAALVAVLFPLSCFRPKLVSYDTSSWNDLRKHRLELASHVVAFILPVAAVIASGSSTGLFALVFSVITFWLASRKLSQQLVLVCLIVILTSILMGHWLMGDALFDSSGRFEVWKMVFEYWRVNINPWLGAGLGTFFIYGPHIQITNNPETRGFFIWAHNDPLQVLFELGLLGFLSTLALFIHMLWRAYRSGRAWLASAVATYGFVALTQMPLRHLPFAFLGALLIRITYTGNDQPE